MKLYESESLVASAGSFSSDYFVLPEHKRVFIDRIIIGLETGTTAKVSIAIIQAGKLYPIESGLPIDPGNPFVSIAPSLHLEAGAGLRMMIENLGAADRVRCSVWGVK